MALVWPLTGRGRERAALPGDRRDPPTRRGLALRVAIRPLLLALVVAAAACGGDDGGAASTGGDTTAATGAPGTDTTTPAAAGDEEAGGPANPCDAVTQQQWEAIFGAGVIKSDASGTADSCNVLTSGSSPGHELALTNLSRSGTTTFDEALATYRGCSGEPTELDLGERAVADGWVLPGPQRPGDGDRAGRRHPAGDPEPG